MPITVDEPTTGGPPAVKFRDLGAYVVVGIVDVESVQSRDYDTGDLEFWNDGNPKMHPRITGLVVSAEGATVGKDDDERAVEPGDVVSIYAQGSRLFTYRDAVKTHGAVSVGDVMRWKFDHTTPTKNPRHNPVKVFTAELRKPEGKDGDLSSRCEAEHFDRKKRPTVDAAPAPAPAATAAAAHDPF